VRARALPAYPEDGHARSRGDGAAPGRDVWRHARVEAPEMAAPHGDGDGRWRAVFGSFRLRDSRTRTPDLRQRSRQWASFFLFSVSGLSAVGTAPLHSRVLVARCALSTSHSIPACNSLPASVQRTMVADSLLAASEHHLPLSTATRQELTDLSRENEEMKAELGKLRSELNLFRSEAERVKSYGRARAALRQLAGTRSR